MKKKIVFGLMIFLCIITFLATSSSAVFTPSSINTDTVNLISEKMKDAKNASVFEANQSIELTDETINGNVFLLARDVMVKSKTINGDLFVCAQNVEISEDTIINGNVFIATATSKINGEIQRELYVAGTDVKFAENSKVGYDTYIAAEHLILCGKFERNINAGVSDMEVKDETQVAENLNYTSSQEAKISEKADIENVNFSKQVEEQKTVLDVVLEYVLDFVRYLVITMLVFIILVKKLPGFVEKVGDYANIGSFGTGILGLLLIPISVVLLFILSVTSTFAWALVIAFVLALIISMSIANISVASLIAKKNKSVKLPIWVALVTIITWIVYQIPIAGGILAFIWIMLGLGICIRTFFSKKKKEVAISNEG